MRKISRRVMLLSFLFSLVGLNFSVDKTPCEIATAIIQSQPELPPLIQITSQDEDFVPYLTDYYAHLHFMKRNEIACLESHSPLANSVRIRCDTWFKEP